MARRLLRAEMHGGAIMKAWRFAGAMITAVLAGCPGDPERPPVGGGGDPDAGVPVDAMPPEVVDPPAPPFPFARCDDPGGPMPELIEDRRVYETEWPPAVLT